MEFTVPIIETKKIEFDGGTSGIVSFIASYSFDTSIVSEEVATQLLECASRNILKDATTDYSDVIERYVRDNTPDISSGEDPILYSRSITEQHGESSFTLTLECALPFDMPSDAHRETLASVEHAILDHAIGHMRQPDLMDLRKNIEEKVASPLPHLISVLTGQSLRGLVASTYDLCEIAKKLVDEIAPETPMSFPDIERYAKSTLGGIQVSIGVQEPVGAFDPQERTGQYL